jgi:histidine triad (HIT) family protein
VPDDCLFCKIVSGTIPSTKVAEDQYCLAFRDINPQAPVHIVIVPKEHVASLDAARDQVMLGRLSAFAAEVARKEGIAAKGYRVVVNTNFDGGQTVFHLHLHLLGGRQMKWPPG